MAKIRIVWRDDDLANVYLDEEHLFKVDYDTFGREGQTRMLAAVHLMAAMAGWDVISVEPEYEDED